MAVAQKGAISFGLVHIPVELYTATQDNDIHFNQLSKRDHNRIHYKKMDSDGKEIANKDIVRGFEYEKNRYVVISDEDLESIKTERDRSIEILLFCDHCTISPAYYGKSYYLVPQKGGEKAFALLRAAMLDARKVAVGQTVMGSKETLLALVPADDAILLVTLFYEEEIKELPKPVPQPELKDAEMDMAKRLIESMATEFKPEQYQDEYQRKLRELIEARVEGKEMPAGEEKQQPKIINLMEALAASLKNTEKTGAGRKNSSASGTDDASAGSNKDAAKKKKTTRSSKGKSDVAEETTTAKRKSRQYANQSDSGDDERKAPDRKAG